MAATNTTNIHILDFVFSLTTVTDAMPTAESEDESLPDHLHYINSVFIGPFLCFPGMLANILSLFVWNRPGMKSSTGRWLSGLAVADFCVLLSFIVCDSVQAWDKDLKTRYWYGLFFSYIAYPFRFWAFICSIWFTVGVTIDRYIMVCWITRVKLYCSEKRANLGLMLITINCFLINTPHFFWFIPVDVNSSDNKFSNITVGAEDAMKLSDFGKGSGGHFYEVWIHCIMLIVIPWVTVLAMNIQIIHQIYTSNKNMEDKKTTQAMRKSKDSEQQITRILLAITFTFLLFIGIQCLGQCLAVTKPPGTSWFVINSYYAFAKTGMLYNSSLNFIFYCMNGTRFRNELKNMLGMRTGDSSVRGSFNSKPVVPCSDNKI